MDARCPMCRGKGVVSDGGICAFCGGDRSVSAEARRQYLELILKEPISPEAIKEILKPIKDD